MSDAIVNTCKKISKNLLEIKYFAEKKKYESNICLSSSAGSKNQRSSVREKFSLYSSG